MTKGKTQTAEAPRPSEETQTPQTGPADAGLAPFEQHADALGTPDWALAGVRQQERYAEGQEVSRADFESALEQFLGQEVRN